LLPGFPIRTSSDLSSVGSSPRLIAASHVLHRLLVPRHPPCALTNLATKMLASTVQFSKNGRPQPQPRTHPHGQFHGKAGPYRSQPPQPGHPSHGGQSATEEAPAPSGPNSAPSETPSHQPDPFHPHPEGQG